MRLRGRRDAAGCLLFYFASGACICACLATLFLADGAFAAEPAPAGVRNANPVEIVLNIRLNGVKKGDFVAYMADDGDFFLSTRDLTEMGVPRPAGRIVNIGGVQYLSMKSIRGGEFKLIERTLTLEIQLPPELLEATTLNLGALQPVTPVQARAPGGFLNYQFGRTLTQSGTDSYGGATELGVNIGRLLLLDNHTYTTSTSAQYRVVRLNTQLIYDEPDDLRRWTFGDAVATGGELGSSYNFAGINLSKLYQINPYFVKQPLAGFAGAVALPSRVDVYMNGARVQTENVAPGTFNLQNLNYRGATGLNNLEYVITDPFGREQRISSAYFYSDQLLAKGLHEYSYSAGVMRQNFGAVSNDYGAAAISGFHRYGVTDRLTLGVSGDATRDHLNIGPVMTFNTVKAGVISAAASVSHDSEVTSARGAAVSFNHNFQSGPFSSQLLVRRLTEDYTVINPPTSNKPKLQGTAGVSYGTGNTGTFNLAYTYQSVYGGAIDQRATTLGYTRTIVSNVSISANVSRVVRTDASGYAAFINISYFPASGLTANFSHAKNVQGDVADQVQISKTTPIGEGLGYRVLAQRSVTSGTVSESIAPFVQYNARHAVLTAEGADFVNGGGGGSGFYRLSVAGAVAHIGGETYAARPVTDSFALVKTEPPVPGIRVRRSNAEIGVTDASGSVFVPNIGSYQVNEVALDPKDLPLDYSIAKSAQKIRPPLRSGVVARFDVLRVRAVTGTLKLKRDGSVTPLENYEILLTGDKGSARASTIRGGDFYIENLAPGQYVADVKVQDAMCRFRITVPDSQEIVSNLGDVYCEDLP